MPQDDPPVFDPTAQQSDATLMARVVRGETDCFAELVRRYQPALARVAASRLGRTDWAEDVVQETFLAAFRSCASYDPRFSFRTWLWMILLNQCHGHYQRRARGLPTEPLTEELAQAAGHGSRETGGDSPLAELLVKERKAQLEALFAQLTLAQADALRLRFFGAPSIVPKIPKSMRGELGVANGVLNVPVAEVVLEAPFTLIRLFFSI